MLTAAQETTLAAAIKANADCAAWLPTRVDSEIAAYYNAASTTDAWVSSMDGTDLFEATDVTKFDGLTAGKRDAWRLMLDFAPIDATRQKQRKAIQDVWGNTDSVAVLQACTRKATKAEVALGGNSATTNTVAALKLNWEGTLSVDDVSRALNANP
jgi:hypothetical protein